jgi:hypothetical protein
MVYRVYSNIVAVCIKFCMFRPNVGTHLHILLINDLYEQFGSLFAKGHEARCRNGFQHGCIPQGGVSFVIVISAWWRLLLLWLLDDSSDSSTSKPWAHATAS